MTEDPENFTAIPPSSARSEKGIPTTEYHAEGDVRSFRTVPILPTLEELKELRSFLKPNIVEGAYKDVDEYLGTQFRLLREDLLAPMRSGYQRFRQLYLAGKMNRHSLSTIDAVHFYTDVKVEKYVRNDQPLAVLRLAQPDWSHTDWSQTNRLKCGSLVALSVNFFEKIDFAVVASFQSTRLLNRGILLVEHLNARAKYNRFDTLILMENSSAYFEAYRHNLQVIQRISSLPLERYIANGEVSVRPPPFPKANQALDFTAIRKERAPLVEKTGSWPSQSETVLNEQQYRAVKSAFNRELCVIQGPPGTGKTYVALKIVEMLLLNKVSQRPILVVCYTNHALDQFLEGMLRYTKDIVRVGGSSKSEKLKYFTLNELMGGPPEFKRNMESLEALRDECEKRYNQLTGRDFLSNDEISFGACDIEELLELRPQSRASRASGRLATAARSAKAEGDGNFLRDLDRGQLDEGADFSLFDRLLGSGSSKFKRGSNEKVQPRLLPRPLPKTHFVRLQRKIRFGGPLTLDERWAIYLHEHWCYLEQWASSYISKCSTLRYSTAIYVSRGLEASIPRGKDVIRHAVKCLRLRIEEIDRLTARLQDENRLKNRGKNHILKSSRIIGMTTTGAAKQNSCLQRLKPEIVIVEEAAEVLEAHLIASLVPSTKQLILIGDHQQLQPMTAVHRLAVDFRMEVSLFERLTRNKVDFVRLEEQHRMRDEFLCLLVPHIYEKYFSHSEVNNYPDVRGITSNMFFMQHSHREKSEPDSQSKSNSFEAEMAVRLAYHFRQQGYGADEVTILTTYRGQVEAIEKKVTDFCAERNFTEMYDEEIFTRSARGKGEKTIKRLPRRPGLPLSPFEGMRITTVDNYQGNENKIVIVSLVRSNDRGNIGFLSKENRVCVAMSRAKHGLYCIGNIPVLAKGSPTWAQIKSALEERKKLANGFELLCEKHGVRRVARCPGDFDQWSRKGCGEICGTSLPCDHLCHRLCHPEDATHEASYKCESPCKNVHPCGHLCLKLCSEPCGDCDTATSKQLKCGRTVTGRCCDGSECPKNIVWTPQCGHEVYIRRCFKDNLASLGGKVVGLSRSCGHILRALCDAKIVDKRCPL